MSHTTLQSLSNPRLIDAGDHAIHHEHRCTVRVLDFLLEIDRRSLYFEYGHSSLFTFCVERWSFSETKAWRFVASARALRVHPVVRELLETRRLTVCGLARLSKLLTPENARALLERFADKPYREIERFVMDQRSTPRIPDRVRPSGQAPRQKDRDSMSPAGGTLFSESGTRPTAPKPGKSGAGASFDSCDASVGTSADTSVHASADTHPETCVAGHVDTRFEIRFEASARFVKKLERAFAVCSSTFQLEQVLERALDDLIDRRDPKRREARRAQRVARQAGGRIATPGSASVEPTRAELAKTNSAKEESSNVSPMKAEPAPVEQAGAERVNAERVKVRRAMAERVRAEPTDPYAATKPHKPRTRHIPAALRDAVFLRDGGQCTYVGKDGNRCNERRNLECDHVRPFARGGEHTLENLRLRCRGHNQATAGEQLHRAA